MTPQVVSERNAGLHTSNNLTFLRWVAALMVLFGHAFVFAGQPEPLFLGYMTLGPLGVWIFFAISGYLVSQSWQRDPDVLRFLARRCLRIFPGLAVCILLSVLALGPAVTTLSLQQYFTHPATWGYLDNLYLYITFSLPGVFEGNRFPGAVNGSLWSLPAEFAMYLLLAVVGASRLPRSSWVLVAVGLMGLSAFWATQTDNMLVLYRTDVRQVVMCGVFFWVGAVYQRYRVERFFSVANVCLAMFMWVCSTRWPAAFMVISWFVLPFVTLAFGLASSRWLSYLTRYDYSYGIYIYAFPIQQTLAMAWPTMSVWMHVALAILVTTVCAGLSWHWVEKKALRLKPGHRPRAEERGGAGSTQVSD